VLQRKIPQYFLYGEASQDIDERFLHVESIAARSRLHDWTIRPHAHRDLHHLLLITRGGGVLHADGNVHAFKPPSLISVPLACVHGFKFQPDTDGWIITASGALLGRIATDHPELAAAFNEVTAVSLPAAVATSMGPLFDSLVMEFRGSRPARRTATEAWLLAILVGVLRLKSELRPTSTLARGADAGVVERYRALVEKQYRAQLGVTQYASRLCISQERLRLACVRSAGSSPLALLNARRLLEAKRGLLYTNMSVALIAETCGFLDPAYFSRFFSRNTGVSPRSYRLSRASIAA
jgi:AraC family transcriptional activator of pobA